MIIIYYFFFNYFYYMSKIQISKLRKSDFNRVQSSNTHLIPHKSCSFIYLLSLIFICFLKWKWGLLHWLTSTLYLFCLSFHLRCTFVNDSSGTPVCMCSVILTLSKLYDFELNMQLFDAHSHNCCCFVYAGSFSAVVIKRMTPL